MKKIEINNTRYPEDCRRIQSILFHRQYKVSISDCEKLWDKYSESMAAGWMMLDRLSDEDVFEKISQYIENNLINPRTFIK